MSLEEIENKLVILGTEINNSNYFLHLAEILVNYYKNIFSKSKVKKILLNSGCRESSLDDMRVNLTDLPLSISDKKYLEFAESFRINLDEKSYIIIDLKGLVKQAVFGGENEYFAVSLSVLELYELLGALSYDFNRNGYFEFLKSLEVTSLIYRYAYLSLENESSEKIEITRAGMFRNAYFDIIELSEFLLKNNYSSSRV